MSGFSRRDLRLWAWLTLGALLAPVALGANAAKRSYLVPAGDAAVTLRRLSEISGREILFAAEVVRGVRTNAVRGEFTPIEAARLMLAGTKLAATQDGKTGALAVHRRKSDPAPSEPD